MDISNGSGSIDSSKLIDYFANDFLKDLGKMVVLRDELEKRQGSMKAVDAANKKLAEADSYATSKKAEADALLVDAKAKVEEFKATKVALDAREKDLAAAEAKSATDNAASAKASAEKEASLASREEALAKAQAELKAAQDTLATDRVNLDARIKALQDKVASINI
jgi:chromosome segregation ATPase